MANKKLGRHWRTLGQSCVFTPDSFKSAVHSDDDDAMTASLQIGLPEFSSFLNLSPGVLVSLGLFTLAFFAGGFFLRSRIALVMPFAGCFGFLLASSFDGRVIRFLPFAWMLGVGSLATVAGIAVRTHRDGPNRPSRKATG